MKTPESTLREERPIHGMEVAIRDFSAPRPQLLSSGGKRGVRWRAAAGLAASMAVGGVAIRLSVGRAEAAPLSRVIQAEENASRVEVRYAGPDGRVWGHAWIDGARARFDQDPDRAFGFAVATNGRRFWNLQRGSRTALVMDGLPRLVAPYVEKVSSMGGKILDAKRLSGGGSQYLLERSDDPTVGRGRFEVVTDAADRPVEVRRLRRREGRWETFEIEKRSYGAPIPASTFEFRPPAGYEVYDVEANRARLLQGLRQGPAHTLGGVTLRLAGVLQDRHGVLTAIYTGGATPLPDAGAVALWEGRRYSGEAVVGEAPDPRGGRPLGRGILRFPGALVKPPKGAIVEATPEPYLRLEGLDVRLIRLELPKVSGNPPRHIRLSLPIVAEGKPRTVGLVHGKGISKGAATFDVETIPSNEGEEIFRLAGAKRAAYTIPLRRPER